MTTKISAMTAASAAAGANEFEINESGTTKKVTGTQIATMAQAANAATAAQAKAMASSTTNLTPASLSAIGVLKGLLTGLTLANNGSDATNDIDFTAGYCVDSTGAAIIQCSALTKQLDAAWAAGTNAGGLDTGSISNGTYHCFAIKKDSDGSGDFLFSTSPTAPTMPSGYTYFRRIGSIIRASAAIVAFSQLGDTFLRKVPVNNINTTNPGTAQVSVTTSVPNGIQVEAIMGVALGDGTPAVATNLLLLSPDQTDTAPNVALANLALGAAGASVIQQTAGVFRVRTDTSRVIKYRVDNSDADIAVRMATIGWVDTRGRQD